MSSISSFCKTVKMVSLKLIACFLVFSVAYVTALGKDCRCRNSCKYGERKVASCGYDKHGYGGGGGDLCCSTRFGYGQLTNSRGYNYRHRYPYVARSSNRLLHGNGYGDHGYGYGDYGYHGGSGHGYGNVVYSHGPSYGKNFGYGSGSVSIGSGYGHGNIGSGYGVRYISSGPSFHGGKYSY